MERRGYDEVLPASYNPNQRSRADPNHSQLAESVSLKRRAVLDKLEQKDYNSDLLLPKIKLSCSLLPNTPPSS